MKTCSRCGEAKPLTAFYANGAGRVRGDCKACISRARKARYVVDGELLRARVRDYRSRRLANV